MTSAQNQPEAAAVSWWHTEPFNPCKTVSFLLGKPIIIHLCSAAGKKRQNEDTIWTVEH